MIPGTWRKEESGTIQFMDPQYPVAQGKHTAPLGSLYACDQILENSFKSHIKSGVFLHVFNDISIYA